MTDNVHNFYIDSNLIFDALASNKNDYIYIWDYNNGFYAVSKNLSEEFLIPIQGNEFIEIWQSFIDPCDLQRVKSVIQKAISERRQKTYIEYRVVNATSGSRWFNDTITIRYNDKNNEPEILIGLMHNLLYDGDIDATTGLLKHTQARKNFDLLLENQLIKQVSVMLVGIDGFSTINTIHNHAFGDQVLYQTANDLSTLLNDEISVYRYDGDQFLFVSEKYDNNDFVCLYEKMNNYATQLHEVDGKNYHFTFSAGIASYPNDATNWIDLEKAVMIALKSVKESGKNHCAQFRDEVLEKTLFEQSLSECLLDSITHNFKGFSVVYQPVCHAQNLKVKGAEALLRFTNSKGQLITPDQFIPILEQTRLIVPVGIWVLEQAIKTCKKWISYFDDFVMNVNVSYLQLRELSFCDNLERLLQTYDLDASHITLELTESYFITDAKKIDKSMNRLQELHLQVAMDDFGTGYSSLARLSQFNVDVVKIDRSFVQSLHESKYNYDFIDSVVRLCHNVGMKVCVEGVETKEEQEIICVLNADYVQGYYVSKPIQEEIFFNFYILQRDINDSLIILPNMQLRRNQLISDKDVLTAMMDATPLGLNFWNKDIEIIACNAEIINMFGAKNFEEVKQSFNKFSPEYQPDGELSSDKVKKAITQTFNGQKKRFYWQHCSASGEIIPAEVTTVCIPYMNDYIVASYTRDMREQRKLEEQIKNFNERLRSILDSNPLCLNLWNKEYQNIMCNKAAVTLFGLKDQKEYLECFFELSPEYQANGLLSNDLAIEYINQAFETGYCQFQWIHQTLTGEVIPTEITLVKIEELDEFGNELVAGYTRDLREENTMKEKVQRFNVRLEAILDSSPLCLNLWNSKFENIMCNKAAVTLFGLKNQQEYLQRFFELSPQYQPNGQLSSELAKEHIINAFKYGYQNFKWLHCNFDGEEIPAEITLVKIEGLDEDGQDLIAGYTRDIRTQIKAKKLQDTINGRMQAVLDSSPLACILWSKDLEIIDCNQVVLQMLGVQNKEELINNFDSFIPLRQPDGEDSLVKKSRIFSDIFKEHRIIFEWVYINTSNEEVPCEVTLVRISLEEEEIIVAYSRDLRELYKTLELNDRLSQMAYYDLLTGITSRARFTERLINRFATCKDTQHLALVLFDIDYFKTVNDTYGHSMGDLVLKKIAKSIEKMLPKGAFIGRYGGDEFIILLENIKEQDLEMLLDKIVYNVANMIFEHEGHTFNTSISMGASFKTRQDIKYQSVLNRADRALYQAKEKGRNRFVILSAEK